MTLLKGSPVAQVRMEDQIKTRDQLIKELDDLRSRLAGLEQEYAAEREKNRLFSESRSAEEALRESEQKYRALVESSSDAIMVIDKNRKILSYNRAFLDLFGLTAADVEGKTTRMLHPSDESFRELDWKIDSALSGRNTRVEWELMRKDGTVFPIEETLSAIRNPEGPVRALVGIIRDISKRKKAEEELAGYRDQLQQMVESRTRELIAAQRELIHKEKLRTLGAISAEVAHEIRNPLTSIGGFAKRLKKKYPDSREAGIILCEAGRLEKLLNRINDYLKPVEMRIVECSVNQVVRDAVGLLAPELDRQAIKRQLELEPGISPALVDPGVLSQVLVNVIRNTTLMMEPKDTLFIRTFDKDDRVNIFIENPVRKRVKDQEAMFLPFGEGEQVRISVCVRLLENMGGALFFAQGKESMSLTISLPGAKMAADQVA